MKNNEKQRKLVYSRDCDPEKFQAAFDMLSDVFGPPRWHGCESYVWKNGEYVVKLCVISLKEWSTMRLLSRRQGPFSEILEMKALFGNFNRDYAQAIVVGVIIQKYIRKPNTLAHLDAEFDQPKDRWDNAKITWCDGNDFWRQNDSIDRNAVDGLWVDLTRIKPINVAGHRDQWAADALSDMGYYDSKRIQA